MKATNCPLSLSLNNPSSIPHVERCWSLIAEEYRELQAEFSIACVDLERNGSVSKLTKMNLLKELADLQYVISFFAATFDLPLEATFNRVHKSNMSKLDDNGEPVLREDGKVLKGPNYQPPCLEDLV